ncbi:MAG: hypothetical protein ACPGRD_12175 [Planktomarina sp.]
MLNRTSVRGFNPLYYRCAPLIPETHHVDWDSYFYPLDSILGWNRIYGRRVFIQFQRVLPLVTAFDGLTTLLTTLSQPGAGAFLGVLKRMGPQDGSVSFPMEGFTLELDCPIHPKSLALLEMMDEITLDHGGPFYLTKDARMSASALQVSDPRLAPFAAYRQAQRWNDHFASAQSDRLKLRRNTPS